MNYNNPYQTMNDQVSYQNNNTPYNYTVNYNPNPQNQANNYQNSTQNLPQGTAFNPDPNPTTGVPVHPQQQVIRINVPNYGPPAGHQGDGYYNPQVRGRSKRRRCISVFVTVLLIVGLIILLLNIL